MKIDYAKFKIYLNNELNLIHDFGYGAGYTKIDNFDREQMSDAISNRIIKMLDTCIDNIDNKENRNADISAD